MLSSSILGKTYAIWLNSLAFSLLQTCFRAFSLAFSSSFFVHLFVRESRLEGIYRQSIFARCFQAVYDFLTCLIGRLGAVISGAARGGLASAFAKRYLRSSFFFNFETLLGGFICLMFMIPHDYWANSLAFIASLGLFVLYIILVGLGRRKPLYLHELGLPLLFFALACVFSLAFSFDRGDSFRILLFFVTSLLFLYVLTADLNCRARLMKLLGFLYLAVIFSSLVAVYQRLTGVAVNASLTDLAVNKGVPGRVFGTLGNPNNYAEFLVMMTPLAAVFAMRIRPKKLRFPLCLGIALPFLALLMTYSRSCWISMLITCLVFVYYADKKLIPVVFLLGFAMIPFLPNSVIVRLSSLLNPNDSSNNFRLYVWDGTIKMAGDYLFTGIGLGPGSFAEIYPDYAHQKALIGVPHSHMVYLELIIELGLLGFVSFMWFMLRLWKDAACALLASKSKGLRLALAASLASLVGIAFAFGVEYVWYYPRTFFAYFILAGIALAAIRISAAGQDPAPPKKGAQAL